MFSGVAAVILQQLKTQRAHLLLSFYGAQISEGDDHLPVCSEALS